MPARIRKYQDGRRVDSGYREDLQSYLNNQLIPYFQEKGLDANSASKKALSYLQENFPTEYSQLVQPKAIQENNAISPEMRGFISSLPMNSLNMGAAFGGELINSLRTGQPFNDERFLGIGSQPQMTASQALGVNNPLGALLLDAGTDITSYIGPGLLTNAGKSYGRQVMKNADDIAYAAMRTKDEDLLYSLPKNIFTKGRTEKAVKEALERNNTVLRGVNVTPESITSNPEALKHLLEDPEVSKLLDDAVTSYNNKNFPLLAKTYIRNYNYNRKKLKDSALDYSYFKPKFLTDLSDEIFDATSEDNKFLETVAKKMLTEYTPQTGHGRAMGLASETDSFAKRYREVFGNNNFREYGAANEPLFHNKGYKGTLYTSNSEDTAKAYTRGEGFIGELQRPLKWPEGTSLKDKVELNLLKNDPNVRFDSRPSEPNIRKEELVKRAFLNPIKKNITDKISDVVSDNIVDSFYDINNALFTREQKRRVEKASSKVLEVFKKPKISNELKDLSKKFKSSTPFHKLPRKEQREFLDKRDEIVKKLFKNKDIRNNFNYATLSTIIGVRMRKGLSDPKLFEDAIKTGLNFSDNRKSFFRGLLKRRTKPLRLKEMPGQSPFYMEPITDSSLYNHAIFYGEPGEKALELKKLTPYNLKDDLSRGHSGQKTRGLSSIYKEGGHIKNKTKMTRNRKYQQGGFPSILNQMEDIRNQISNLPSVQPSPFQGILDSMQAVNDQLGTLPFNQNPILALINNQRLADQLTGLADMQLGPKFNDRVDLSNTIQRGVYGYQTGGQVDEPIYLTPGMLKTVAAMKKEQGGEVQNIPVDPKGLYNNLGPVIVPSRQLTFNNINTPTAVIPLPGQDAVMEIPMPGLTKEMDLRNKIAQLDPDGIPSILDTMRSGGRPLTRDYVDKMFLGGLWKGIKEVGKGIGDAVLTPFGGGSLIESGFDKIPIISDIAGMMGDVALTKFDAVTNTLLGQDIIKEGAFQNEFMSDISNAINPILNQVGAVATPILGSMVGIPPELTSMARGAISGIGAQPQMSMDQMSMGQMMGMPGMPYMGGLNFGFPGYGTGGINPQANTQMGMGQNPLAGLGQLLPLLTQGVGLLSSLGNMEQGGLVNTNKARFREGGFVGIPSNGVPIQTEVVKKGGKKIPELIIWPDYSVTEVSATDNHDKMMKNGDGDMVTDIVTEDSFITSAYGGIKIKRSDAEKIETGLKLHPYSEHEKGKMPEVTTLADALFSKRSKKKDMTPAEAAEKIRKTHKTFRGYENTNGEYETSIFEDLTNAVNRINRAQFLEGIMQLSEFEKAKKELKKVERENRKEIKALTSGVDELFKARFGGRVRKYQEEGSVSGLPPDAQERLRRAVPALPSLWKTTPSELIPGAPLFPVKTLPTAGGESIPNPTGPAPEITEQMMQNRYTNFSPKSKIYGSRLPNSQMAGRAPGSSFLQGAGTFLSGAGAAASALDNFLTAGQLGDLLGSQKSALDEFRDRQQQLFTGARLMNIAPSLLGPEAAQREQLSQRRFISPTRAAALQSAGLDTQFGQMMSAIRNNPNITSGEAISSIINAQAPSRVQIAQDRLGREQAILSSRDQIDDANIDVRFQNEMMRNALANSRLQNVFGNVSGLFTDVAGNEMARIRDAQRIEREQLLKPQMLRQAGLQGITNVGGVFLGADALNNRNYMYDTMQKTNDFGSAITSMASNPILLQAFIDAYKNINR